MTWVKPKLGYFWCEVKRWRTLCGRNLREIGRNLQWTEKQPDRGRTCPDCLRAKEGSSEEP